MDAPVKALNTEKAKALQAALAQIEKQFGKGTIMRLGEGEVIEDIQVVSTGSLGLDIALGVGGLPRGRVVEIYGPESSGKTTLTLQVVAEIQKNGGTAAFVDAEHALDAIYAERLRFNPGAERLVAACRSAGLHTLLVSGGFTFFSDRVRDRLHIDETRSNVLEIAEGRLTGRMIDQPWGDICDGDEKRRAVLQACERLGIEPTRAIAVGDGANDLPMMGAVGLSVAYHAKPAVRERATVSIVDGGLDRLLEIVQP